ncbi:MAG TPA: hypothetical protein VEX18_15805 [Polyangiaceae bacterium]|nr:hypothetical protein [Polyangiaceae bacterium]
MAAPNLPEIQATLDAVVEKARRNRQGAPADYIPELASVPLELTSAAVLFTSGDAVVAGDTAYKLEKNALSIDALPGATASGQRPDLKS